MAVPVDGIITEPGRTALGQWGAVAFNGAGALTLVDALPLDDTQLAFVYITFFTETVLSVLTSANPTECPAPTPTGLTFPANSTLAGNFSAITVTSGSGIAYQGPRL